MNRILVAGLTLLFFAGLVQAQTPPSASANTSKAQLWLGQKSITIDGDFDEWTELSGITTTTMIYGGAHKADDAEGTFKLSSDNKRLYIFADVQDDKALENDLPPAVAWRSDSVEVCIGLKGGHKRFEKEDSHIRLVPRSRSDMKALGISINDREVPSGVKGAVVYHDRGYRIEVSIPLQYLFLGTLSAGQNLRVDFQVNDADITERDRLIHWNSTKDDIYFDPSSWGDLVVEALK